MSITFSVKLHSIIFFQRLPAWLIPAICVFVDAILIQRDHKVLRCYIIQRVVQSVHLALQTRAPHYSTSQRSLQPVQLVALSL